MKWKNAQKDELPQNGQEVLISVHGVYYISVYHAENSVFKVNDNQKSIFSLNEQPIYWTDFHNLPNLPKS